MPRGHAKVDKIRAVELVKGGATMEEVAKTMNCTKQAVSQAIKGLLLPEDQLDTYKDKRADIYASLGARILSTLTPKEIKKIPAGSRITQVAILQDKELAIKGLPGQIIAYFDVNQGFEQLQKAKQDLVSRLGYDPTKQPSILPDGDMDSNNE